MASLSDAIDSAIVDCLRVNKEESVLIMADSPQKTLAQQFFMRAERFSQQTYLLLIPALHKYGEEPPKHIASLMTMADVIVLLTSRSISHTNARRMASLHGARIASLPGISETSLMRTLTGNYKTMIDKSRKLSDIFTIGRKGHLSTAAGTDLKFSISRMRGYADTGMLHEPGSFSNLPAGEGCVAPVAGTTEGQIVLDGSFPTIGILKNPVRIRVQEGMVTHIYGDSEAVTFRSLLRPFGKESRNIAEIGIGTNQNAKITGCTVEDEKSLGTAHIGFGNNISFGGKVDVPCHFDGVLLHPTLVIDGKTIVEEGELQV